MRTLKLRNTIITVGLVTTLALLGAACAAELNPIDPSLSGNDDTDQDDATPDPEVTPTAPTPGAQAPSTTIAPSIPDPPAVELPTTTVPDAPPPAHSYIAAGNRMGIGGCPIYPRNNVFHADIRSLAKHRDSDRIIAALGTDEHVKGMRSTVWEGSRGGYPVNVVNSDTTTPTKFVTQGFFKWDTLGYFPLPAEPRIEGFPTPAWDQHLLLFDTAKCVTHEMSVARTPKLSFSRGWEANSAYTLDMTTNVMPGRSSTVAGFSLLAGLVRYEELASGSIDHVLTVGIPNTSPLPPVWPAAIHSDGKNPDPHAPRIGSWFRLKNVDMSQFGPDAQVVIRALQKHGAIVKDTNFGKISINGENSESWDSADMRTLENITAKDFEIVDPTPMIVSRDSYEIR